MTRDGAKRVLLLTTPSSYRTEAFLHAARRIGVEVVQAVDLPAPLSREWNVPLGLDFARPEDVTERIVNYVADHRPFHAIISVDDSATVLAAMASARLGLPSNAPESALAARDKLRMRELLADLGWLRAYGAVSPVIEGEAIARTIARDGTTGCCVADSHGVTAGPLADLTGHRVASVFWDYLTSGGTILERTYRTPRPLVANPQYAPRPPLAQAA